MNDQWTYLVATCLLFTAAACGGGTGPGNGGGSGSAPAIGENLVESPDAEGEDPTSGWIQTGCLTATSYGEGDGPDASSKGPSDRGDAYFSGRGVACKDTVGAAQWIEHVSDLRESGVAGDVPYNFEVRGYLGGWGGDPDHATFSAYFLNQDDRLIQAATLGPVSETDRGGTSQLLERSVSEDVPDGTDRIMLLLEFRRFGTGQHKGVADNLSFTLTEKNDS
ncbi:MAG: hypothetical protein ABEN55_17425 [Bradymonadaceae bacterium]